MKNIRSLTLAAVVAIWPAQSVSDGILMKNIRSLTLAAVVWSPPGPA